MLFNSYIFIFLFLPIVAIFYYLLTGKGFHRAAMGWLVFASLFFYGWLKPIYVLLIIASTLFNFIVGHIVARQRDAGLSHSRSKLILIFGITGNLAALGYFKYANFFVDNLNLYAGTSYNLGKIILPLAISFHTFRQIAYLVDTYRGKLKQYDILHYSLFATFFPPMIAGPIVRHDEMLPQFEDKKIFALDYTNLAVGVTVFAIGLFKKVVLADNFAIYVSPIFDFAAKGLTLSFAEAWGAALGYTLQLYFDFSGYSDMAIGLARMFGIKMPINFNSPYKSLSIIEFWRRWHITLSRFLRDYLYIPLGGNRKGKPRQYWNLMITMLLAGIWHGAGFTFFVWGGLHGLYLVLNNLFRQLRKKLGFDLEKSGWMMRQVSWSVTFVCVAAAWVIFRADNLHSAGSILKSMFGFNGLLPSEAGYFISPLDKVISRVILFKTLIAWIFSLMLVARFMPNTQQLMRNFDPGIAAEIEQPGRLWQRIIWRPSMFWAVCAAAMLLWSVLSLMKTHEFLYFQF